MLRRRMLLCLAVLSWPLLSCPALLRAAGADEVEEGFTPIFNGRTLEGWEGNEQMFRVVEGAIVAGTLERPIPHNEFLATRNSYGDFELRLKFKLLGKGANAGVQVRSQRVPDDHEVSGYQADLGENYWGALYDESRRNRILASPDQQKVAEALKADDWNDYIIRCEGPRIQLWINGLQTVDYTEVDKDIPRSGILALQIHGGAPSEAHYKDLRIKVLEAPGKP